MPFGMAASHHHRGQTPALPDLLRVGFDTLDMGSFVSPKAMPAMADTGKSLRNWKRRIWDQTDTRALVIVANERGARDAVVESVSDLGFL